MLLLMDMDNARQAVRGLMRLAHEKLQAMQEIQARLPMLLMDEIHPTMQAAQAHPTVLLIDETHQKMQEIHARAKAEQARGRR